MRNLFSRSALLSSVLLIALFIISTGFSQKKSNESQQTGTIKLAYNYLADKPVKYMNVTKITQDMDINGQSMLVNVASCLGAVVRLADKQANNLNLEIKVDTLGQSVDSPQGSSGGAVREVMGKVFKIVISPSGKTIDLTDAAKVVYNVEGAGESNLAQSFMSYFPALPENPVKIGDTWTTKDTIDSKTQSMSMWMPVEAINKLEGIKTIDGTDCAILSATLSGSRKMSTQSQGMTINTSGTFTGTMTLLFAIKEGYFVKETVTTKMTGTIEIPDQNMSFPLVMDIVSTNEIVK
jgi:hypothetical protein